VPTAFCSPTDHPNASHAAEWFDHAAIGKADHRKSGRINSGKLLSRAEYVRKT
jgi:hypothetical protein